MKKISVLIPDGESPFAFHVLACLSRSNNVDVHIISKNPNVLTRFSRKTKSFTLLKRNQSLLEAVTQVCSQVPIDLCMPVDMNGIYYFSKHAEQIQQFSKLMLMQSPEKLREVWDKGRLAEFLSEKHFLLPSTITNRIVFEEKINSFSFPVLVKPRMLGNGEGIIKYIDRETLSKYVNEQINFFEECIIQEFVEGEDIDCSVLCKDGNILAYTIQNGLNENVETYKPAEIIEFSHHATVLNTASELMSALKWNGVAHIDMRIRTSDKAVLIIEINPRFWGSVEGSSYVGVNFPYLTCLASLDIDFPLPEYQNRKYMSAFSALKRILKNKPVVNLIHETNLMSYLKDPIPALVKLTQNY